MKLVNICHVFPPEHAPAGVNARDFAEDMARAGHEVTVLTGWPNHPCGVLYPGWTMRFRESKWEEGRFTLVRCGHSIHSGTCLLFRLLYYMTFAMSAFVNGLFCREPDVIFCESTPIFGPVTGLILAWLKRAKFVYRIHDVHPEAALHAGLIRSGLVYRLLRNIDTWVCKRSDLVLTLTDGMRRTLLSRGLPAEKVVVARQWLDGLRVAPRSRNNLWRRGQGIPLNQFVALYAGTIGHISGARVVIEAARLLQDRSDILFLFVGEGPVKAECEGLARDYCLEHVRFLPFQPAEVLADVQATSDVGLVTLLPGYGDMSVPSKIHGYTAAGRPVIGSVPSDSATAEAVRRGRCGLVVEPGDPKALAEAIVTLAASPIEAADMGRNARQFFCGNFDRRACTARLEDLLRNMLTDVQQQPRALNNGGARTPINHSQAA